jgi:hypothetical protein
MLGDCLPSHGQPSAEFAERLAIFRMQLVEQMPAVHVGQGSKDSVILHLRDMQPSDYLSPLLCNRKVACQAGHAFDR